VKVAADTDEVAELLDKGGEQKIVITLSDDVDRDELKAMIQGNDHLKLTTVEVMTGGREISDMDPLSEAAVRSQVMFLVGKDDDGVVSTRRCCVCQYRAEAPTVDHRTTVNVKAKGEPAKGKGKGKGSDDGTTVMRFQTAEPYAGKASEWKLLREAPGKSARRWARIRTQPGREALPPGLLRLRVGGARSPGLRGREGAAARRQQDRRGFGG
jgi:hypothetical protein